MAEKSGSGTEPPPDQEEIWKKLNRRKYNITPGAPVTAEGGLDFAGLYSQEERKKNRKAGWVTVESEQSRQESAKERFKTALEDFLAAKWENRLNVFAMHGESPQRAQADIKNYLTYYMDDVRVSKYIDDSSPLKKLLKAFKKVQDDETLTTADHEALRNGQDTLESMTSLVLDGGGAPPTLGPVLVKAATAGYFGIEFQTGQRYKEAVLPRLEAMVSTGETKAV